MNIKRYFIIEQHIARPFVHYSECFYHPAFPSMQLKQLTLLLLQGAQPITIKSWEFSQLGNPYKS